MAQPPSPGRHDHGRPLPPPRPEPAAATATVTATAATVNLGPVSLDAPRPDGDRQVNEYVETPFRPPGGACRLLPEQPQLLKAQQRPCLKAKPAAVHRRHQQRLQQQEQQPRPAITKQPVSFTKEPATGRQQPQSQLQQQGALPGEGALSIMCERCGRCRCESCREPPPMPSRWLCNNACLFSAETVLDYASCLCCVKGLFYHCADLGCGGLRSSASSLSGRECADEPCSCTGSSKAARWTCLSGLSLLLPCLVCYWPLKGCVSLCEAAYAKYATQGCRCEPPTLPGAGSLQPNSSSLQANQSHQEKRLLDPQPEL